MRAFPHAATLLALATLLSGCPGTGAGGGACANVACPEGQGCDTQTGACVPLQPGDACGLTCSGTTPVCEGTSRTCKVCTAFAGCGGTTPVCNTAAPLGTCVQCTDNAHCGTGQRCLLSNFSCVPAPDGGAPPDAGSPAACAPACGGLTP
ncbi:MAG: hypothetical protein FJ086_14785, partial [Deltaproteobacteria bacterium]|nr:hypothetical protein [Deltaproteobacteria bacterium]